MLLVAKKPDADFVPFRAKQRVVVEDTIHLSLSSRTFKTHAIYG